MSYMTEINEATVTCPHCQSPLITYHNVHRTGKEDIVLHNSFLFSDGDTIPFNLTEFDPTLSWSTINNDLMIGSCPSCSESFYAIEIILLSKPIGNEEFLVFWEDDIKEPGKITLHHHNTNEQHIIQLQEDFHINEFDTDNTLILNLERHFVGPFPLKEEVAGEYGVSQHHGKNTWVHGAEILSTILSERKEFLHQTSKETI